ncbi:MAG TPA: four helix bundle protein, partial [Gemmatimonadaceae bacterium]|nr:four helix bundle protein [Gemmatimonadaceae bacterium]
MSDFKKLRVWQTAHALSLHVHRLTTRIRNPQFASLRSQAFRAAMSIPANIAEGRRQTTDAQFARYLGYALNSASELEYHLIVARDTRIISEDEFATLAAQTISVRKMLYTLMKRLPPTKPKRSSTNATPK